eukprot:TRINITY_DN8029_c0_g1_i8.p1 TRINITY_DN8029_c0_g1~~TRINITY_DN8029_c0_g1_i8.p1  ORF type:complete len:202 (-),score=37.20 TRINITY_DN8029_c0_g1_i8:122-727(-)
MKSCDGIGNCWDDFLGNGDNPPSYSDRLFSTSMALNALYDTWTTLSINGGRLFRKNVPPPVLAGIEGGSKWLDEKVTTGEYPVENVFFSGSLKSPTFSMPLYFPNNYHSWLNGTEVSCSFQPTFDSFDLLVSISGYVDPGQYESLEKQTCFGHNITDKPYPGMNCEDCTFPFWSSPALTYAAAMSALAKFVSVGVTAGQSR